MPEVFNTVSSFTIEQLGGEERRIRLVGRGLPYRPFSLKTTQRVELTWLPGSPQATATVLGPTEEPTTINGWWKDRFLGEDVDITVSNIFANPGPRASAPFTINGLPMNTAREAADVMDAIVREGTIVEVKWDEDVRHGYLIEFEKKWHNIHDLEWDMKFEWISRGEPTVPGVFGQEVSLSDLSSTLGALGADLSDFAFDPGFAVNLKFFDDLTSLVAAVEAGIDSIQNAVATVVDVATTPANALRSAVASCTGIAGRAEEIRDLCESRVSGTVNGLVPINNQTSEQRSQEALYVTGVSSRATAIRREAVLRHATLIKNLNTTLLSTYTARAGDDLRDVSRLFYGTPFQWRQLMVFNGFDDAELEAGELVLVPVQTDEGST